MKTINVTFEDNSIEKENIGMIKIVNIRGKKMKQYFSKLYLVWKDFQPFDSETRLKEYNYQIRDKPIEEEKV